MLKPLSLERTACRAHRRTGHEISREHSNRLLTCRAWIRPTGKRSIL